MEVAKYPKITTLSSSLIHHILKRVHLYKSCSLNKESNDCTEYMVSISINITSQKYLFPVHVVVYKFFFLIKLFQNEEFSVLLCISILYNHYASDIH